MVAMSSSAPSARVVKVARESLHVSKPVHWLESRFHFSFSDFIDLNRMNFGALRVLNDDLVKPREGFGAHPHRDAEIFSYVVDGELTHQDSMGNKEALGRGCVQYMSAGKGVVHSEMNDGDSTCRFLQVWLTPDRRGHKPQYGSSVYSKADRHNRLLHILGGTGEPPAWRDVHASECIKLHQDANVYVSELDAGKELHIGLGADRQVYMVVIEGALSANGETLRTRDGAKVVSRAKADGPDDTLVLTAGKDGAHLMLIEMAAGGR